MPTWTLADLKKLAAVVAERHGLTLDELRSKNRTIEFVNARREAAMRMFSMCKSFGAVGRILRRDRTSIMSLLGKKKSEA